MTTAIALLAGLYLGGVLVTWNRTAIAPAFLTKADALLWPVDVVFYRAGLGDWRGGRYK